MQMKIILLERIAKLGQMGDIVTVKAGYARNFLLPQGKALRANKANQAYFETRRTELEARNLEHKKEAQAVADKMEGLRAIAVRSAGETGQLYGSVAARDIVSILAESGFNIGRNQVQLQNPIKIIGLHTLTIALHPEVEAEIIVNVARSEDEAARQDAGEDLTHPDSLEEEETEDAPKPEDIFDDPQNIDLSDDFEEGEEAETESGEEAADTAEAATEESATEESATEKAEDKDAKDTSAEDTSAKDTSAKDASTGDASAGDASAKDSGTDAGGDSDQGEKVEKKKTKAKKAKAKKTETEETET